MKKTFLFCFLFSVSVQYSFAQVPTQAEIDKMMKDAQALMKKYGGDSLMKNTMKIQQGNNTGIINSLYSADPGSYGNVDNWKFPAKNTALLSSLPKKVFTKAELVIFLNDLFAQLSKKLPANIASSVQVMTANYKNDGNKMGDAAMMGWYSSHPEESILLIVKAAAVNPDNELLLNNCAALLNLAGIEQKAIPILKYVLQSYPNNSMLLNNLGQAYAGLGELDTAMIYLMRCMKITPEHAEACGTAGFIEESKGNTEKAVEYFEKSIKKGYSKVVELKLRKLKKGSRIANLIRPRIKLPEYFNQFKYDLPAQCISVNDALMAEAEHNTFRKMITQQLQKYGAIYAELTQKKMEKSMRIMNTNGFGRKLNKNEFMAQPYYELSTIMAGEVLDEYKKEMDEFHSKILKQYNSDLKILDTKYQAELKTLKEGFQKREADCCGEGKSSSCCPSDAEKCEAFNNLANTYLPQFAYITEVLQKKAKLIFRTYFDELVYWHYLSLNPVSKDDFRMQYYYFIQQYLNTMGAVCQTRIIKPCIAETITSSKQANVIKEMDCPLDFGFSFVVGSIELDCEKFSIEGGEIAIFKYELDFKTKESTLNIGIGAALHLGKNFRIGAEEYAFIKFDGSGHFSDGGIKMEAFAEATLGEKLKSDKDKIGVKTEVGYTLGIESGWNFNEGPFKKLLTPKPEVPQKKNMKIYNPG